MRILLYCCALYILFAAFSCFYHNDNFMRRLDQIRTKKSEESNKELVICVNYKRNSSYTDVYIYIYICTYFTCFLNLIFKMITKIKHTSS